MFGDSPQEALYGPAARVLEAAKRTLNSEKRSFKVLTDDARRIEGVGNKLDRKANQAKVVDSETAIGILDATAHSSGPVRSALLAAAQRHLDGDRAGAVRDFLDALAGIDLQAAARGMEHGTADGGLPVEPRRALDADQADAELVDGRGLSGGPTAYDEAVAAGHASLDFSDPVSTAARAQADAIEHDLKLVADQSNFRLSDDGDEISFIDAAASANSDIAAIEALKGCL